MTNYKVIVKEDRTIIFPDRDKIDIMAVQYDHNVTTLNFECPRYIFGEDISTKAIFIKYNRRDNNGEEIPVDNIRLDKTDKSKVYFDWTLTKNVTGIEGAVEIVVNIRDIDEEGVENLYWSTFINKELKVGKSIPGGKKKPDKLYPDALAQLELNKLNNKGYQPNKVLVTNSEGKVVAVSPSSVGESGVPDIDQDEDEGKILKVVNGEAKWENLPSYTGDYEVTPAVSSQTLDTSQKYMESDLVIKEIPYSETSNVSGGNTVYIGKEL